MSELLIGCGSRRNRDIPLFGRTEWRGLVTLDANPDHKPDVEWDLMRLPLPFDDNSFDEIHAYEVLEHLGPQGDFRLFFDQFSEFWRLLTPGGAFAATVPAFGSRWMWGDPSHTRVIQPESLVFLDQAEYVAQIGVTQMSDFRRVYRADFIRELTVEVDGSFRFVLRAVKPARLSLPS